MRVRFTEQPVRHTATAKQPIYQAVDLGGHYRVLDLLLSVYLMSGASPQATVTVQTSMQATDDDQWVTLGTYTVVTVSNTFQSVSMSGALRYVRYSLVLAGTSPVVVFDLSGYARTHQ